jgi:WD40 repeat protein
MAVFSIDGKRILTTADDKSVRVWNASTGALMTEHADNPSTLQTLALSPDGMRLVAPAWDGTVQIWDSDGNVIAWLRGHTDRVNSAAFSPDGTKVISASWDHTARVWRLPPRCQSLIDAAKAALPRAVTQSEKTRFFLGDRPVGNAALTLFKRVFAPILPQEGESCR